MAAVSGDVRKSLQVAFVASNLHIHLLHLCLRAAAAAHWMQVFRHAVDIARRESSARVMLRHLESAIKEIFSSALLPTIKGLCAQVAAAAAAAAAAAVTTTTII